MIWNEQDHRVYVCLKNRAKASILKSINLQQEGKTTLILSPKLVEENNGKILGQGMEKMLRYGKNFKHIYTISYNYRALLCEALKEKFGRKYKILYTNHFRDHLTHRKDDMV